MLGMGISRTLDVDSKTDLKKLNYNDNSDDNDISAMAVQNFDILLPQPKVYNNGSFRK